MALRIVNSIKQLNQDFARQMFSGIFSLSDFAFAKLICLRISGTSKRTSFTINKEKIDYRVEANMISCLRSESRVETGSVRKYYFRRKVPRAGMCNLWKCFSSLECRRFPEPTLIMLCSNKRCCVMTSALQNRLGFLPPKFFTFVCFLFSASREINSF